MDQFYFESGYLEAGYLTIVKEASAGLTPYIAEGYLPVDYFNFEGNAISGIASLIASLTRAGEPVFAVGTFATVATTTAIVNVIRSGAAQVTATFTQSATISHIEGADLFAFSNAQLEAAVRRIRDNNITASAAFSVAVDVTRTRNLSSDDFAEFSFTANTVRSRDYASSQSAAFSLTGVVDNRTRDQSSALASAFAVTATISHIEGADLTAFSNAALTANNERTRAFASAVSIVSSVEANVTRNPGIIQNLSSQFTQSANAVAIPRVIVSLSSAFTFFTDYDRIFAGPTALSGGSYDTAVINTSTTKFGAGSLSWTMDSDVQPTSDVFWTGSEFVAANTSFKWTSSDGVSWTRTAITGAKIPLNYGNGYYFNGNQYSTDLNTWSTISATIPGSSSSFISSIGYTASVYYIFTQYTSGGRFRGGYASASTPGGSWTHTELYDGGTTGAGSQVQLLDFNQSNGLIAVVVTGTGGLGLYVNHFNGSTVTNIAGALPTLSINTNNFAYEQFRTVATKASTQYLRSVRDTQNPRRDGIVYTNGASTGSFVFGTSGGSDQEIKYVINDIAYVNNIWLVYTSGGVFKSTATVPTSYSDFTLTSDQSLGKLEFGASKYVSTGFYSSDATTWTVSVPGNTTGYQGYLEYAQGDGSDLGNWSTIDFWAYVPDIVGGTTYSLMIVGQTNQTNYLQWGLSKTSGAAPFIRFNRVKGDVNDDQTNFVSSGDASQGWHHIRISASSSNLAVYYDGVRKIYRTDAYGTFAGKLRLRSSELLIDDLLVSDTLITDPSVASFTVPTIKSSRDANTDLLLRFDTDFSNLADLAPVIPRANISAVSTVSATVKKTISAASSLGSQFTQTAEATVLVLFEAALASEASTSATILRIKSSAVTLDSAFTQTTNTDLSRTRSTSSVQSSAFTQSTEAVKTTNIVLALNSQFTFTGTISHIEGADLTALSNAALTVVFERIRLFASSQDAVFTQTADAIKTADAASSQFSAFTQTTDANRIRGLASNQSSAFTQSSEAVKTANIVSALNSQATFTATISHIEGADLVAFSNAAITTTVDRIRSGSSSLEVTATQTTQVEKTVNAISNQSSSVSQTASVVVSRGLASDIVSATSLSASNERIRSFASSQSSAFTQASTEIRIRPFNSAVVVAATQTAAAIKTATIELALIGFASELALGRKDAVADPLYLYVFAEVNLNTRVTYSASKALTTTATIVGNAKKNVVTASSLNVVASQTAIIDNRTRSQTANVSAVSSMTVSASKFSGPFAFFTSAVTQTIDYTRIRDFDSSFYSVIAQSAQGRVTRTTSATLATASSFTATISHILGADLVANNFATLTAVVEAGKFADSNQSAAVTLTANTTRTRDFDSQQSTAITLTATVNEVIQLASNLAAEFNSSTSAVKTAQAVSSQSALVSVTCVISHIEGADLVAENFATMTTSVSKITGFTITATSTVNFSASAFKIKLSSANLAASTSLSVNALKLVNTQAALQAQATIVANAGKQVLATVTITSAMTFIAQVREIDLDSINQVVYIIPRETWAYTIPEEVWLRNIPEETRIYTLKEE